MPVDEPGPEHTLYTRRGYGGGGFTHDGRRPACVGGYDARSSTDVSTRRDTMPAPTDGPKDATPITQARNRALLDVLPFDDTQDFEDARRGFLGTWPEAEIRNEQGRVVWSFDGGALPGR